MKKITERRSSEYWRIRTNKGDTIIIKCNENDVMELWRQDKIVEYTPLIYYEMGHNPA